MEIEVAVRNLAREDGELYVVTGPIFVGERLQALHGRVLGLGETNPRSRSRPQ